VSLREQLRLFLAKVVGDFKNSVSFSASKFKVLFGKDACHRRAWYAWYRMWNGWWWRQRAPHPAAESAYKAKFFQSEASFAGTMVHEQASWSLNRAADTVGFYDRIGGESGIRANLLRRGDTAVDRAVKQATRKGEYQPKTTTRFLSIEEGGTINEDWMRERVRSRLVALTAPHDECVDTPFSRPINLFTRALENPKAIISIEKLLKFQYSGIDVFMQLDLQTRTARSSDECLIIDWKSGKPSAADRDQLVGYSVWARSKGWKNARMILVYLEDGVQRSVEVDMPPHKAEQQFATDVSRFIEDVKSRIVDGDLERNEAIEAKWEPTSNPAVCRFCQFKLICESDGTKPSH
jgi:hypothetical protein